MACRREHKATLGAHSPARARHGPLRQGPSLGAGKPAPMPGPPPAPPAVGGGVESIGPLQGSGGTPPGAGAPPPGLQGGAPPAPSPQKWAPATFPGQGAPPASSQVFGLPLRQLIRTGRELPLRPPTGPGLSAPLGSGGSGGNQLQGQLAPSPGANQLQGIAASSACGQWRSAVSSPVQPAPSLATKVLRPWFH